MIKPNVGENYHKRSELEVRVCNMPGSWAHRDNFFLACLCLSGEQRISIKPCSWATESEEVDHTASCSYISSRVGLLQRRERGTHTNTVFLKAREGGMERDTTGSLLSLKGKACRKWNSCTDSVTMDQYSLFWFLCENRMWRWTVYSCCADSLGVTETAGKGVEQQ